MTNRQRTRRKPTQLELTIPQRGGKRKNAGRKRTAMRPQVAHRPRQIEAGRYPVDIYRPGVRWALTYIIPLAFLTTFPAATLLGKLQPLNVMFAVFAAAASLVGSSLFFRFGLRHYSGASA